MLDWIEDNLEHLIVVCIIFIGIAIGVIIYHKANTPDAYIDGRPVKFTSRCIRSHTEILLVPIVNSDGNRSYTTMQPVPQFICDESVIVDTVYMDN